MPLFREQEPPDKRILVPDFQPLETLTVKNSRPLEPSATDSSYDEGITPVKNKKEKTQKH